MKIRALKSFEGIRDNERNVYPKAGDVWEVSEERANFLKSHGVIEIVEEEAKEKCPLQEKVEKLYEDYKKEQPKKKKSKK